MVRLPGAVCVSEMEGGDDSDRRVLMVLLNDRVLAVVVFVKAFFFR